MNSLFLEFEWSRMGDRKGTLLVRDDGLYFQPYQKIDRYLSILGDSISIGASGVFGAINLIKKLESDANMDLPEAARIVRDKIGLDNLLKNDHIIYFPWNNVAEIKKRKVRKEIVMFLKNKDKILVKEPFKFDETYEILSERIVKS